MKSEKQKMMAGELYLPGDPQLQADLASNKEWLARYNSSLAQSRDVRLALLRERLGAVGDQSVVGHLSFVTTGSTSAWDRTYF